MHSFIRKHHRKLFFTCWLLINLVQAYGTELIDDEAYYWIYSLYPAWGYFDHPPMIGILIKAGYAVFQNELGVRLMAVILNTATIYIISRLIIERDDRLFYGIAFSIAIAHVGGIIAAPDVPLLFFVSLFFLVYSSFLKQASIGNTLLLGVSIALMLYTKYHGILVVLFTLLSNPKLLRRYQAYLVALIAIILFLPHLYWQYNHAFPSVQYHLFERNAREYRISFTLDYIAGQILIAGPLVGWLLIWAAVRFKSMTATEKALKYTLVGFYLFFLISSFKGRVEANWTIPAFVALIVLSHGYLKEHAGLRKWFYRSIPLTIVIVLSARIYMLVSSEVASGILLTEFHNNRKTAQIISREANGRPVVFTDSYQRASKHWFYTGVPALSINTPDYRRNNFNFWPVEESFYNKEVFVVSDYDTINFKKPLNAPRLNNAASTTVPAYFSFMKVEFSSIKNRLSPGNVTSSMQVRTPARYLPLFQQSPYDTASIQLALLANDSIWYFRSAVKVKHIASTVSKLVVNFPVSARAGEYEARIGISSGVPGEPSLNSPGFKVRIE